MGELRNSRNEQKKLNMKYFSLSKCKPNRQIVSAANKCIKSMGSLNRSYIVLENHFLASHFRIFSPKMCNGKIKAISFSIFFNAKMSSWGFSSFCQYILILWSMDRQQERMISKLLSL